MRITIVCQWMHHSKLTFQAISIWVPNELSTTLRKNKWYFNRRTMQSYSVSIFYFSEDMSSGFCLSNCWIVDFYCKCLWHPLSAESTLKSDDSLASFTRTLDYYQKWALKNHNMRTKFTVFAPKRKKEVNWSDIPSTYFFCSFKNTLIALGL